MFAKRRPPPASSLPVKKRKYGNIEEISFDFDKREDYLTGFHKRKLQRIKHAQEEAAKKEREERIATRKALREERKAEAEQHVEQINALLKDQAGRSEDSDRSDEGNEEWSGIEEPAKVDHEDEYQDEDKFTTVTVEEVDVTKDGMRKVVDHPDEDEEESAKEDDASGDVSKSTNSGQARTGVKGKRVWTKDKPQGAPPKKKKKFRYESKADRKITRMKERRGNKSKAKERKG